MLSPTVIPWLPLAAIILHLIEEFVWPGGFPDWYREYRPERASSVTTGFLVRINALFVLLGLIAGAKGITPYGVAVWLVVASIAATNGLFHLWATIRARRYSPGVITGCLVYLPLAVFGVVYFWSRGLAGPAVLVQAALVGPAYHVYAAWNHRRRARSAARNPQQTQP
jgi:hypothetical protein